VVETTISLPFITADATGPKHLEMRLTRSKFEQLTADLVERCVGPVQQALADAKLTARDLDKWCWSVALHAFQPCRRWCAD